MIHNKFLIEEPPLQILPQLAAVIGLNEAILLQQMHYWLQQKSTEYYLGEHWVKNTYESWRTYHFPFWSAKTIQRIIIELEHAGIVITTQRDQYVRQKLHRIDYDVMDKLAIIIRSDYTVDRDQHYQDVTNYQSIEDNLTTTEDPTISVKGSLSNSLIYDNVKDELYSLQNKVVRRSSKGIPKENAGQFKPKLSRVVIEKKDTKPQELTEEERQHHKDLILAVAKVTQFDLKLQGPRVGRVAKMLRKASYTADQVYEAYELWKQFDFRWRQGRHPPTPEQLLEAMGRLKVLTAPVVTVEAKYEDLFDENVDPTQTLEDVLRGDLP